METLEKRVAGASPTVRTQIERLLDQDADDVAWSAELGPAYRRSDVACLLGITPQAVGQRKGLLALRQRNQAIVYPIFQFDGDRPLAGVDVVVTTLMPVLGEMWTIASWLISPRVDMDGKSPVDVLRDGGVDAVKTAVARTAASLVR